MSFVIKKQQDKSIVWLLSTTPEAWGERDQATRFDNINAARRAAIAIKVSGDWSIDYSAAVAGHMN